MLFIIFFLLIRFLFFLFFVFFFFPFFSLSPCPFLFFFSSRLTLQPIQLPISVVVDVVDLVSFRSAELLAFGIFVSVATVRPRSIVHYAVRFLVEKILVI